MNQRETRPAAEFIGRWPHRLAWALVVAAFSLIFVGATVTGYGAGMSVPDWPTTYGYWFYPWKLWLLVWDLFLEHGHRMLAQLVGVLTIVLAVLLWRRDRRASVRWLVVAAVAGVILQGTLGGLRVIADARILARVHGCTAPLLFTVYAALVSVTSKAWLTGGLAAAHAAARRIHRLIIAIAAGIYLEIVLGTQVRVPSFSVDDYWFQLLVWAKVVNAALIAVGLAWLWIATAKHAPPAIVRRARLLAAVFALQVVLACGTWVTHYGWPAWCAYCFGTINYTVTETGRLQVVLTSLHVGVGSVCLALASGIALWSYRLLRELPE